MKRLRKVFMAVEIVLLGCVITSFVLIIKGNFLGIISLIYGACLMLYIKKDYAKILAYNKEVDEVKK